MGVVSARGQNKQVAEAREFEVKVGNDRDRVAAQGLLAEKLQNRHAILMEFEDLLGPGVRASGSGVDHGGAPREVAGVKRRGRSPTGNPRKSLLGGGSLGRKG